MAETKLKQQAVDFGEYVAYVPTFTNLSLGNGSVTMRYSRVSKTVHVYGTVNIGTTTSITGSIGMSLPVTAKNTYLKCGTAQILDQGTALFQGNIYLGTTSRADLQTILASGTYTVATATSSTIPMTWANTDAFYFDFTYEAA